MGSEMGLLHLGKQVTGAFFSLFTDGTNPTAPIAADPGPYRHLEGQIVVLLLLVGPQRIPPLPQDLADCAVVLVWVSLVHQGPVAFTEDHECIHGTADVVLLPLVEF